MMLVLGDIFMRASLRAFQLTLFAMVLGSVACRCVAQEMPEATAGETVGGYASTPEFQAAVAAAKETGLNAEERLARWKKANELAKNQCMECFRGVIDGEFRLKQWQDAVASSVLMDGVATAKQDKMYAEASAGRALLLASPTGLTLEQVTKAEGYLRSALAISPRSSLLLFQEGRALATLHQDDEAKATFAKFLETASADNTSRPLAEQYVKDPQPAAYKLVSGSAKATPAEAGTAKATAPPAPAPPRPAYLDDPKFQKALAQAKEGRQTQEDRLENWKHANKVAGGQCIECLHQMIQLQSRMGAVKDEAKSAELLEAAAADNPREKFFAEGQHGAALLQFNYGEPKPEQLHQADTLFRDVLAYSPRSRDIIFQEGRVLAKLGKYDEAKAMFDKYVDIAPASDKMRLRAERFSDDPHLATLAMAPPFRLVTSDGQEMQLDDMNGKVVLIDFWATWCGPCKETLPEMQRIARDYANDPLLVIISVSTDADAGAWRAFIQKNNMTWPQYRDANNSLSTAYGVTAIPRFFTIDTNGTLKSEQVGSGADVRGVAVSLLKKAHKAEEQKAKASDKASSQNSTQSGSQQR
jgi:thiol-disulfide isomerase/thioredoxin